MRKIYLALHNIRSVHNVGSIFRTADATGVAEVLLCGITPTPIDRFGRARKDLAKVSLGAEKNVPWKQWEHIDEVITHYKNKKIPIVAVEQTQKSVPYHTFVSDTDILLIVGEETKGLPESVLKRCDTVVEIPMKGRKESLNVSIATGVVLFRFIE